MQKKRFDVTSSLKDCIHTQRTLEISLDISSDSFTLNLSSDEKPYLTSWSPILFEQFKLEFVTPVFIKEKLLSRKITSNQWTGIYPYQKNTMKNENSVDSNYLISKTWKSQMLFWCSYKRSRQENSSRFHGRIRRNHCSRCFLKS